MALSLYVRSSVTFAIEGDCIVITGPSGGCVAMSPHVFAEGLYNANAIWEEWSAHNGAVIIPFPSVQSPRDHAEAPKA